MIVKITPTDKLKGKIILPASKSYSIRAHIIAACGGTSKIIRPSKCEDALEFNYSHLQLTHPVFFIGGLPQMGGDILATNIIDKIDSMPELKNKTGLVFAGTYSKRQLSGDLANGGWSSLIEKHDL